MTGDEYDEEMGTEFGQRSFRSLQGLRSALHDSVSSIAGKAILYRIFGGDYMDTDFVQGAKVCGCREQCSISNNRRCACHM